jgi:formamidopyrimidine-DNA glycosylase
MIHAEVVRVNHQQARRGRIAQALLDRLTFAGLGNADLDKAKADRKEQE